MVPLVPEEKANDGCDSHTTSIDLEPPALQNTKPANPGQLWRPDAELLSYSENFIVALLEQQHRSLVERLDHHEELLRQSLPSSWKKPATAKVKEVEEKLSVSGSEATSSHATSSVNRSAEEGDKAARSKDKKPTLFSTWTAHDLLLRKGADEVAASQSQGVSGNHVDAGPAQTKEGFFRRMVMNPWFDPVFSVVVITNSIFIGIDVQLNPSALETSPPQIVAIHYLYTFLFCVELLFRSAGLGREYFCSKDWIWSVLDIFIVVTSLWEVFVDTWYALATDAGNNLESFGGLTGLKAFRIVRITRIVKTVRLMRIFRFVLALRTLIHSILHTLKSLFWALVLLFLVVYVFGLIFTQAVNGHVFDEDAPPMEDSAREDSLYYYGSLVDTMLSLFMSVTDGVSWEKLLKPLTLISPFWSFLYLFYISFTYFAVLNVLTGVFCQSAIESAQNDHATAVQAMMANKEMHLHKIRTLFSQLGDETGVITFDQFEAKINSAEVREYFETLGLDVWDAWGFFKMLDKDGGGSVEIEEFLKGCLRFRGQAKAIDMGQLLHDQAWLLRHQSRFHTFMEMELQKMKTQITALAKSVGSDTPRRRKKTGEEKVLKSVTVPDQEAIVIA